MQSIVTASALMHRGVVWGSGATIALQTMVSDVLRIQETPLWQGPIESISDNSVFASSLHLYAEPTPPEWLDGPNLICRDFGGPEGDLGFRLLHKSNLLTT